MGSSGSVVMILKYVLGLQKAPLLGSQHYTRLFSGS